MTRRVARVGSTVTFRILAAPDSLDGNFQGQRKKNDHDGPCTFFLTAGFQQQHYFKQIVNSLELNSLAALLLHQPIFFLVIFGMSPSKK